MKTMCLHADCKEDIEDVDHLEFHLAKFHGQTLRGYALQFYPHCVKEATSEDEDDWAEVVENVDPKDFINHVNPKPKCRAHKKAIDACAKCGGYY